MFVERAGVCRLYTFQDAMRRNARAGEAAMDREKLIHDMILMLIYLTSCKEDAHVGIVMRS